MKVALLGLGFMGVTHLRAWKKIPSVQVVAVASDDPRALSGDLSHIQGNIGGPGERFDFSGIAAFANWQQAATFPEAEIVDICLPTHLHAPAAITALRAGKHVLVEKPMALDSTSASAMIQAATDSGCNLMVAHVLRFWPEYLALQDYLRSGRLGPVRHACFQRRCAAPTWSAWLTDKASSGGAVLDLVIHDIDVALHLFGLPQAVSATGWEDLANGIDVIHSTWHYDNLSVTISGGWFHPRAYPFSMEYMVVADKGTLDYHSSQRPPRLFTAEGEELELALPAQDGYEAEIQYFHDCCLHNRKPMKCLPEESATAVRMAALMAYARSQKGEKIPCQL